MHTVFGYAAIVGFLVAFLATIAADLFRGRPEDIRWHLRKVLRFIMAGSCAFSVARLLWAPAISTTPEHAVLALSLAGVMVLRAQSELRRQRAESTTTTRPVR